MCWHSLKDLVKIVGKLRNMPAFPELVVKKLLTSIEMCCHSQKELLKSVGKIRKVLKFPAGAVKNYLQA